MSLASRRRPERGGRAAAVLLGSLLLAALPYGCRKTGGMPGLPSASTGGGGSSAAGRGGSANAGAPRGGSSSGRDPGVSGMNGEGGEGPDPISARAALLGSVADCTLSESRALLPRLDALIAASDAQIATPSEQNLEAMRTAWLEVMQLWERLEVFQFGPLAATSAPGGQGVRANIYPWPSFNRCFVDQQIVSRRYAEPTFPDALSNSRGLGAIEYLTFYTAADNGCAPTHALNTGGAWAALDELERTKRKAEYARAAALDVRSRVQGLIDTWDPALGDFWHDFANAGDDGSVYPSLQAGFNAVSDALFYLDTEVKDMKIAWPLGLGDCGGPCPSVAESPFAGSSTAQVRNNLIGFRLLYEGCSESGRGLGFDDVLIELGQAELAERMRNELEGAIETLDAIEEPSIEAAVAGDLASVQQLYAAVKRVTDLLKTEFVGVLDLSRPMGAEGDND